MPTLPVRFISQDGPNIIADPDVRFLKTVAPNYKSAEGCKIELERTGQYENHDILIYRLSRRQPEPGQDAGQFNLWRQLSNSNGDQHDPYEPAGATVIGYAIYAAQRGLANDDPQGADDPALSNAVKTIGNKFGQEGDPTNSRSH